MMSALLMKSDMAGLTRVYHEFPSIDGHFWLERDGKVIDTEFKQYEWVRMINNLGGEKKYKEADATTQFIMISMFDKCLEKNGLNREEFKELHIRLGVLAPMFNCCFQNCINLFQEGDVLKFGSMGWENKRTCNYSRNTFCRLQLKRGLFSYFFRHLFIKFT